VWEGNPQRVDGLFGVRDERELSLDALKIEISLELLGGGTYGTEF
jgi:hypothetical protein